MIRKPLRRREMLRGLAGTAIALPWLEAMSGCTRSPEPTAHRRDSLVTGSPGVAPSGLPRRFISLYMPNGVIPSLWFPEGGVSDFTLSAAHESLKPHRKDIVIFRGIDNAVGKKSSFESPHFGGMGAMLTGMRSVGATEGSMLAGGPSLDQVLGKVIAEQPLNRPPFRSLVLGTHGSTSGTAVISYGGPAAPIEKTLTAKALFEQLFGNSAAADAAKKRSRQRSVLDGASRDAQALRQRLGASDRQRIDQHLTSIREIEQRLSAGMTCNPNAVKAGETNDLTARLPEMVTEMFDVLTLAISCDLTRAITYQLRTEGETGGFHTYGWLGVGPLAHDSRPENQSKDHHHMSHNDTLPSNKEDLGKVGGWYASQLANLIERLKALPEGSGTAFDNTAILLGSAIGQGNHTLEDIPYIIAGSCGGSLRTGQYLQLKNVPNNNLLVSLMNAMGVPGNTFGDPEFCTGPLPGLLL
jgi:Protein of unknown function (DUF1552)